MNKFKEFIGTYFEDLREQASEAGRKAAEEMLPEVFVVARDMLRRDSKIRLWVVWPVTRINYPSIRLSLSKQDPFAEVVCGDYPGWDSLEEFFAFKRAFEEVLWDAFDTRPEGDDPEIIVHR